MDRAEVLRARSLIELSRYAPARDLLARGVAGDPHDVEALCLLAQACLGLEDEAGAARAAQAACVAGPDEEWGFRLLALARARRGEMLAAHQAAEQAVRLAPDSWRTHLVRAQVDLIGEVITPTTREAARQAVRLAPDKAETHRVFGAVLLAEREHTEAEAALRTALRLDPQDAAARNDLARLHAQRRNFGRAAAGFADAAALNPSDQVAARNLVVVGARALRVVHWILWAVVFTAGRVATDSRAHARLGAAVGFAVATVALIAFGVVIWRGAHPRTLRLVRIILRRDRLLAGWAAGLTVGYLFLGIAVVVPTGAIPDVMTIPLAALLIGLVLSWVRSRRAR